MSQWKSVCLKERERRGGKTYMPRWWDGQQSRYGRSFHDQKSAKEYAKKLELHLNGKGPDPDIELIASTPDDLANPRRPWHETVDDWLKNHSARKKTQITYKSFLTVFAEAENVKHVDAVTESVIRGFLAGLQKGDSPKSPATVAGYLKVLSAFFRSVCPHNCPVTKKLLTDWKPYTKYKRATPHRYSHEEFLSILDACDQIGMQKVAAKGRGAGKPGRGLRAGERGPIWWRGFLTLLYRCGLRFNEAARLLVNNVDFDKMTISIRPHDKIEGVLPWRPKSKNAIRTVPMSADVADALTKLQDESPTGIPYMFVGEGRYHEVMRKKPGPEKDILCDVGKQFRRIRKRAGLNEGTLHDWRRTFITDLLVAGVAVPDVVLMAGHDSPDLVLKIYNEISGQDALERVRVRMAETHKVAAKGRRKVAAVNGTKK